MILGCSPQTHLRHYWGMAADLRDRMVVSVPGFGTGVSGQSHKKKSFRSGFGCKSGSSFHMEAMSAKGSHCQQRSVAMIRVIFKRQGQCFLNEILLMNAFDQDPHV